MSPPPPPQPSYQKKDSSNIYKTEIQAKISKRGGLKNFWIKWGLSLKEGGVKDSRGGDGVGFLDIIFHPFQILFLVSLNR